MQRRGVEQRLQAVVGVLHLGRERRWAVVPRGQRLAGRREPVRLVVGDRERVPDPHDEVDAAGQVAADAGAQLGVLEPIGVAGERVARRRDAPAGPRRSPPGVSSPVGSSPPTSGSSKVSSSSRSARRDVAQPEAADKRAERRLDRGAQSGDDRRAIADVDRPPRQRRADGPRELGVEVGRGEVGRLEHGVGERAELGPPRAGGKNRGNRGQRRVRGGTGRGSLGGARSSREKSAGASSESAGAGGEAAGGRAASAGAGGEAAGGRAASAGAGGEAAGGRAASAGAGGEAAGGPAASPAAGGALEAAGGGAKDGRRSSSSGSSEVTASSGSLATRASWAPAVMSL